MAAVTPSCPFASAPRRAVSSLVLVALLSAGCGPKEAPPPPPPQVSVADVVQRDVPVFMEFVGQTSGFQDVEIRARVEGYLESVAFREGMPVKAGDVLYQIDPKPLAAQLANQRANLATAQARLARTETDVARLTPLEKLQAVSRQELDDALSQRDAARAQVDAARADVEVASLDLGYARITSPIDGIVGTTLVKPGALVGRGESTLLTTVSTVDPILFRAGVSEAEYLRLRKQAGPGGANREQVPVQLLLADGSIHEHAGRIEAVERAIDPTTGTLMVQFRFPNPDKLLRPGQYGRARLQVEEKAGALLVPQRAVAELQNLYSVAVVGAGNKVELRNVEVGPRVENLWVVEKGVAAGEKVVVEGLQRLKDGMVVSPVPIAAEGGAPGSAPAEPVPGKGH